MYSNESAFEPFTEVWGSRNIAREIGLSSDDANLVPILVDLKFLPLCISRRSKSAINCLRTDLKEFKNRKDKEQCVTEARKIYDGQVIRRHRRTQAE